MEITPQELLAAVEGVNEADLNASFKVLRVGQTLRWNGQEVTLSIGSVIRTVDYGIRQLDQWVRHCGLKLLRLQDPSRDAAIEKKTETKIERRGRGGRWR